jgi:hypothetical protein
MKADDNVIRVFSDLETGLKVGNSGSEADTSSLSGMQGGGNRFPGQIHAFHDETIPGQKNSIAAVPHGNIQDFASGQERQVFHQKFGRLFSVFGDRSHIYPLLSLEEMETEEKVKKKVGAFLSCQWKISAYFIKEGSGLRGEV